MNKINRNKELIDYFISSGSYTDTGKEFGISKQRVYQIVSGDGKFQQRNFGLSRKDIVDCREKAKIGKYLERIDTRSSDECWNWKGEILNAGGYGLNSSKIFGSQLAHRISWVIHRGAIPRGLCVLHKCDNPLCCNPNHLFLGTQSDNSKDRHAKGRDARGESSGARKLSNDDIKEIIRLRKSGLLLRELASKFGVTNGEIHHILSGRCWKHIVNNMEEL